MKILLVHNTYRYKGGEETYIENLRIILESNGNKVSILTQDSQDIKTLREKIMAGVGLFWSHNVNNLLEAKIRTFKPDIIQFQNIFPLISPSSYWAVKKYNIPIVQRISNYRLLCPKSTLFREGKICELCVNKRLFFPSIRYGCFGKSPISSFFYALAFFLHKSIFKSFSLIDMYIFPSSFVLEYVARRFPIEKHRTAHIPTLMETQNIVITNKKRDYKYLVYVGRISEEKGVFDLIDIFMKKENNTKVLIVIGDGPDKTKAIKKAKSANNIIFKYYADKKKVLNAMSDSIGIVVPSKWFDVQPNVILEALSVKTPVIAPDRPNFREIVNEKSGYFYHTLTELEEIIRTVWKRPFKGRDKIALPKNNQSDIHYKKLMGIYNRLLYERSVLNNDI